jgi:ATP-dependent Lon protease
VPVPEQNSETLIPQQKLPAGHVFAIGANQADGDFAVYRLENKAVKGSGKIEMQGIGLNRPLRESMNAAWFYFQNNARQVMAGSRISNVDLLLYYEDVQSKTPSTEVSLAEFVGLCSALLDRPVIESLAVIGEIKLSGSMGEIRDLENIVRVAKNAGARKILLPTDCMSSFMRVPGELLIAISPIFYLDPIDAAKKALDIY